MQSHRAAKTRAFAMDPPELPPELGKNKAQFLAQTKQRTIFDMPGFKMLPKDASVEQRQQVHQPTRYAPEVVQAQQQVQQQQQQQAQQHQQLEQEQREKRAAERAALAALRPTSKGILLMAVAEQLLREDVEDVPVLGRAVGGSSGRRGKKRGAYGDWPDWKKQFVITQLSKLGSVQKVVDYLQLRHPEDFSTAKGIISWSTVDEWKRKDAAGSLFSQKLNPGHNKLPPQLYEAICQKIAQHVEALSLQAVMTVASR